MRCRSPSAASAADAPTLASGANIAAFNLGNAVGAWAGGLTLAAGLGYVSPLWVGAGITFAGLMAYLIAVRARGGEFAARAEVSSVAAAA
ncbi:hypothetical protein JNN96_36025 [Mycobacterium sp. DSM 3803]|nr:hypothetical protein [Mycobacterium sp. DSM 3803]